jgi:predicted ATPase
VRLFLERAAAVRPTFGLTAGNAAAVSEICRRLDGIPLAIELAAARLRSLPAESIAAHLDDRFRLLTGGDRTALPRQQTLRALIDWSHDLLTERERIAFRRLAVFAGGWTLAAAEAVVADANVTAGQVLDLVNELVDKSLVIADVAAGRYHLLETIRDYAQARLVDAGEYEALRDRHVAFYLAIAEEARAGFSGPQQAHWLARVHAERENILAAIGHCARSARLASAGLKFLSASKHYFIRSGQVGLAEQVAVEALANAGAQARDLARGRALFSLGQIRYSMGRYRDARAALEESLAIARELEDRSLLAAALQPLGLTLVALGDHAGGRRSYDAAIALAREIGNGRELAAALSNRAQLHRIEGEFDTGQQLDEQALQLLRELGDQENIAIALLNLAMVKIGRRALDAARADLREALAVATQTGSKPASQSVVEVAAGLAASEEDWRRAARWFGAADAYAEATGLQRDTADAVFFAPLIERTRLGLSADEHAAAANGGRSITLGDALAEVLGWLGPVNR